ncbi:hypothetical protein [Tritonibacter mobilis]|uniref:hypothetical protein n=1 Tax=Tritonibacter mobilis TaxID=379347 RepID=UPI001C98D166|nr:hypothetical protein [Tritonibacter mobilis]MBY6001236.1 hypothetical protein [Tritonibacter mobilis]
MIFRILALFALAVAVVMAVIDATRSIAASALIITPLGESWYSVSPDTLNLSQALIQRYTFPVIWDPAIIYILTLPGWLVFAVLALLFHAIGYRRKRHAFS